MAKKPKATAQKNRNGKSRAVKSTSVRHSALPKTQSRPTRQGYSASSPKKEITREQIAERAYFISISGTGRSQDDNWAQAERELRGS